MFEASVVDVNGERLVLDAFHYPGTSEADLAALQAVVDSNRDRLRLIAPEPCGEPAIIDSLVIEPKTMGSGPRAYGEPKRVLRGRSPDRLAAGSPCVIPPPVADETQID